MKSSILNNFVISFILFNYIVNAFVNPGVTFQRSSHNLNTNTHYLQVKADTESLRTSATTEISKAKTIANYIPLIALLLIGTQIGSILPNDFVVADNLLTHILPYFLAGGVCASLSHGLAVPADVIKIKQQTYPETYSSGVVETGVMIAKEEGVGMLMKGVGPTVLGYSIHGSLKYGLYELSKPLMLTALIDIGLSPVNLETKLTQYVLCGVLAETVASTFILPMEASRIRTVADPNFADDMMHGVQKVMQCTGNATVWLSLPTILLKHIPFTVMQMTSFELFTCNMYSFLGSIGYPAIPGTSERVIATAVCALGAGMLSSLVSQPGDTLLNKMSTTEVVVGSEAVENPFTKILDDAEEVGVIGLFSGTKARLVHIAVIYVIQLLIYDSIKSFFGIAHVPH